jgi:hypothetical protein
VPGHGVIIPVDAGAVGGPRGCIQRWKVSVMIMRPPQHGQGGRGSASSSAIICHSDSGLKVRQTSNLVFKPSDPKTVAFDQRPTRWDPHYSPRFALVRSITLARFSRTPCGANGRLHITT